jgi:hypothetical protein
MQISISPFQLVALISAAMAMPAEPLLLSRQSCILAQFDAIYE